MIPVVVLNYNGLRFLEGCINSLRNQTYPDLELIVVDNASSDGSVKFMRERYPDIKIVVNDRNYGFASGYNQAIRKLSSRYVALLNNDVVVDENWLKTLVSCFESHRNVFACGSRILLQHPKDRINHAGARVSILGGGWDERFLDCQWAESKEPYLTGCACGAAMMVNRKVFLN